MEVQGRKGVKWELHDICLECWLEMGLMYCFLTDIKKDMGLEYSSKNAMR